MNYRIIGIPVAIVLLVAGSAAKYPETAHAFLNSDLSQNNLESTQGQSFADSLTENPISEPLVPSELTLTKALALSLHYNPTLASFGMAVRARDAAVLQADLLPNPELEVEMENFAGKNDLEGFSGAETTIAFSQIVELGGKRGNRRMVANLDKHLAKWDYQSKKLDILSATTKAFVEVLIAQEQVALNHKLLKFAEQTIMAVSERVDAGKVSPVEKSRARIELASARTDANKAVRELESARRRLAGFWQGERADFDRAVGQLGDISAFPDEESLKAFLSNNPDLARWTVEIKRSKAALSLARSEAIPDVTLSAGIRNFQETGDNAFGAGISIPIPFFNRNQGGVSEARALIDKAQSEQQAEKVGLVTALSDTWQNLAATYAEAVGLRDEILPNAQAAYDATQLGYREGKLDFLQMLDVQRTLFTVKRQYLLSLGAYHLASTDLERLMGVPLSDIETTSKDKVK